MPLFNWKCKNCGNMFEQEISSYNAYDEVNCPECGYKDVEKIFRLLNDQKGVTMGGYLIQHNNLMDQYVEQSDKINQEKIKQFNKK